MAVAVVLVVGGVGLATWFGREGARPVSVEQAQRRAGPIPTLAPGDNRPRPGVYLYSGAGTDKLSLPPMTQQQGPTMPATVTAGSPGCWTLRIDYSTHHWQSWDYCWRGADVVVTSGRFWQLWPVGPINITNLTSLTCSPPTMVLPASPTAGQVWATGCAGTSTAVGGRMENAGRLTYLGPATVTVAGKPVAALHFVEFRTDTGSQRGTERYETWLAPGSGLPLRLQQDISVTTGTPFGQSTYTQQGSLTLTSLSPSG